MRNREERRRRTMRKRRKIGVERTERERYGEEGRHMEKRGYRWRERENLRERRDGKRE